MSISLYILGSLVNGNSHPYKMKREFLDLVPGVKISEGKFYYNLESLVKKGYIEAVESVHIENRPNKTIYSITKEGKEHLEQEIYNSFKKGTTIKELYVAIYLMKFIDPMKASVFLEESIQREKKRWNQYKEAAENIEEFNKQHEVLDEKTKQSVRFITECAFSQSDLNLQWMEKLLELLKHD